jgi:hypothetical protein
VGKIPKKFRDDNSPFFIIDLRKKPTMNECFEPLISHQPGRSYIPGSVKHRESAGRTGVDLNANYLLPPSRKSVDPFPFFQYLSTIQMLLEAE